MMKKVISLLLCLVVLMSVFAGCAKEEVERTDKGAYIYMYLTDEIYDFDPAHAYGNEAALRIVSLMFDNLFVLDEKGKVQKSLAKDYKVYEDDNTEEYKMVITLNDTCWTDGVAVTANDVVYSWKRILDVANSFDAACLLYDIKYAREAKEGEMSIDDVRIYALNETQIEVFFNGPINYDQFLLNLTSYALAPLREDIVKRAEVPDDWAKKPSTIVSSGPFRLREVKYGEGLVLERNSYYYRDIVNDEIDISVTPYRLIVDYTMTDEEIMNAYRDGKLFFVGDIPLSLRGEWAAEADVKDTASTHTYFLNQNAVIRKYNEAEFEKLSSAETVYDDTLVEGEDGDKIFAKTEVRQALSLAINRQAIADAVVFAKAATGLIPATVYNSTVKNRKETFRAVAGDILATGDNIGEAQAKLAAAGVNPADYMFAISVPAYDEVHVKIAEMVQGYWNALGFHVALNKLENVNNEDILLTTGEPIDGVLDDIFAQNYRAGKYEVAAVDYTAFSADPFSMLAPFAKYYTGGAAAVENSIEFRIPSHLTGYDSSAYNDLIHTAFMQKDINARAGILHDAERKLMEEMPVIPIIFNQTATLTSELLSNVSFTYYRTPIFKKTELENYQQYLPETTTG